MSLTTAQMEQLTADGLASRITSQYVKPAPSLQSTSGNIVELKRGGTIQLRSLSPVFGASMSYSIVGGADAADFMVGTSSGLLTHLALGEQGATAEVTIRQTDSVRGGSRDQTYTVTFTEDANGGGTGVIATPAAIARDEGPDISPIALSGTGVASWAIIGGADAAHFRVVGGFVEPVADFDYDAPADANADNVYLVRTGAYDAQGTLIAARDHQITVADITTDPIVDPEQSFTIAEAATAGTVVGTVAATVDDGKTAQDFTIIGGTGQGLFSINSSTGEITLADTEGLGSELWAQPGFDAATGLSNVAANWTIAGSAATGSSGSSGNIGMYNVAGVIVGRTYEATITIDSISTGSVRYAWDGVNGSGSYATATTAGTHTHRWVAEQDRLYIYGTLTDAVVSAYTVKEVVTIAPTLEPQMTLIVTVSDGTATSFPTEITIDTIPTPATAPTLVSAPSVSGTPSNGNTLTAGGATWSDTPDSIERQWEYSTDGSTVAGSIGGATGATWVTDGSTYDGDYVRVTERAEISGQYSDWAASAWVGPVNTPVEGVSLVNTSTTAIAMGEMTPPGARLPMIFEVQGAAPGAKIKNWTMASDPDGKFYAGSHGVFLRDWLDYSTKTSHTGIVQVTMDDDTIGTFSFSLSVVQFTGTTYYVDHSTGNDSNAGTSTGAPFKTLSKARSVAVAGDRVYVKAGAYGNQSLTSGAAGTFADPIVYIGYQTTPGDNPAYGTWDEAGNDTPNASLMPHIDRGTRENDNTGILLSHPHNFAAHFTISNFMRGANVAADWCGVHRLYTREHGRTTVRYSGYAIFCGSSPKYCGISHCYAINANAQTITMGGAYGAILDSSAFCDNNATYGFTEAGATDYYLIMSGDYGTIRNCYARRAANVTTHGGHGCQFKDAAYCFLDTLETDNTSGGSGVRHVAAHHNVMRNVTITGDNGAIARDGAHDNLFENWTINNAYLGVRIMETHEDEAANPNNWSSKDNDFVNFTLNGVSFAIAFESYNQPDGHANGNLFDDFKINTASYLFRVGHYVDSNNVLQASTLTGVSNYQYLDSPRVAGDNQIQILTTTGVPA